MSGQLNIVAESGCLLDGRPLHPAHDPLRAARREVAGCLARCGPKDVLVLAGAGLGWHARAVLDAPNHPQLVVFEPDLGRLSMLRALGPALTGAVWAHDEPSLVECLSGRAVYGPGARVEVFAAPAYLSAEPGLVEEVRRVVRELASRARIDRDTRQVLSGLWLEHLAANFQRLAEVPDISRLAGGFAGVPAVVVGAGPSLDQSLAGLTLAREKALVLAAASALGPMAKAGLAPHLALALEGKDESRQFQGADKGRTALAAALSGHPNHFSQYPGPASLFHLQPWTVALAGSGEALPTGGHATSAAFSLALLLGCDPIVLVGQDLAYTGGRIHASHRPGGEDESRPRTVRVAAIGGGEVETSPVMQSYLSWYAESAAHLAKTHPGRRVLNATTAGAAIPGFEQAELAKVLGGLSPWGGDDATLPAVLARIPRPSPGFLVSRLSLARAALRGVMHGLAQGGSDEAARRAGADSTAAALWREAKGLGPDEAADMLTQAHAALRRMGESINA